MKTEQSMIGGLLGIALVVAVAYFLFFRKKGNSESPNGETSQTSSGAPNPAYGSNTTGNTSNPDVVAQWWQYSETMKQIQQNLNDTCLRSPKIAVDGVLGAETIAGIKRISNSYAKQLASEIEATKQVTKSQATWLLKKCT